MRFTEVIHGGRLADAVERYGGDAADWLDLSTGINPVPVVIPPIASSVWARLPDRHLADAAASAAAAYYGCSGGVWPLPAPGTQALIQCLPALADGGRVAVLGPTYGEYRAVLRNAGITVGEIAEIDAVGEADRIVIAVNPNNPDGRHLRRVDLLALSDRLARRGGLLVVDEAFADCDPAETLAADAGVTPGLLVLRSFGKFFGLAGLRLGFALAEPELRVRLDHMLGPWAVSGPALAIAAAIMGDERTVAAIRRSIRERRAATRAVLAGAGLALEGETPLFFLARHPQAAGLQDALCRKRILVRAFDYAPAWLRFGLTPGDAADARLSEALAAFRAIT